MTTTEKTFIKNRHDMNMAVTVEQPEKSRGLIFITHGFLSAGHRISPTAIAEVSLANQLTSVRFDTTHSCGESDGQPENATITSYKEDLNTLVDWAKKQDWFRSKYFLAGSSLGGIASLEHAHNHPEEVLGLGLLAPVISGDFSMQAAAKRPINKMPDWQRTGFETRDCPTSPTGKIHVPWSHMEDRFQYNALAYAPEMQAPLMIIVGSHDESCPADQQQQLFDAWGATKKELHIVNGAPHGFGQPEHVQMLKSHFDNWLKKVI